MGLILPLWYQLDFTFFQNFVQISLPLLWRAMTDFFHWEIIMHIISQCYIELHAMTKYIAIWLVSRKSFPILKDLLTAWSKPE